MTRTTKAEVKGQKPRRLQPTEWCYNPVDANFCVSIGIGRRQRALLREMARQWGIKQMPNAGAARMLVMLGLANLPHLEAWWRIHFAYAKAEGFRPAVYLEDLASKALMSLAAKVKE